MRYIVMTVVVLTAGVFLWPLLLQASRKLSEGFIQVWDREEAEEQDDDPTELDNSQPPISTTVGRSNN